MYAGAVKQKDGSLRGWRECAMEGGCRTAQASLPSSRMPGLLNREVIRTLVGKSLPAVVAKHGLKPEDD